MEIATCLVPRVRRVLRRDDGLPADAVEAGWNPGERVGGAAGQRGQLRPGLAASMISDWIAADAAARLGFAAVVRSSRTDNTAHGRQVR